MPKEPRQRLTKELAPQGPKVRRSLPKPVFDRLQAGRDVGKPYRYTAKDVRAIVRYLFNPGKGVALPICIIASLHPRLHLCIPSCIIAS